mmetsp:Transcript_107262/g.301828  ORF Transcript_107262/g.301828 Transcript_107262/m.301828 type:complete len:200 (-) Transcript_107262:3538-4137(-)
MEPRAVARQLAVSSASEGGAAPSPASSASASSFVSVSVSIFVSAFVSVFISTFPSAFAEALPPATSADCSRRTVNFSIRPSTCFSFSMNCMTYRTRASAPAALSEPRLNSGSLAMISGKRLYTTFVVRLDNSWKRIRATRAVASWGHAVSQSARTSNTARGFIMSLSTRCVSTKSAVRRNSMAATSPPLSSSWLPARAV